MRRCFCLALHLFPISPPPLHAFSHRCLLKSCLCPASAPHAASQSRGFRRTQCCVNVVPGAGVVEVKPRAHVQPLGERGRGCVQRCLSHPHGTAGAGAERLAGGLLHLLAGTVRDHLDNCFSALFGSAFGAEAALSMRACCPSWVKAFHFSSTRTPQPIVILLVSAQHRRFVAARLRGCLAIPGITILALSSIAVLSQATPKFVSPRKCRGSALVSSGPPPTFSVLANCGGIVGVSFWGIVLVVGFFGSGAV